LRFRLLLVAALLVRVALAATPGFADDRAYFQAWARVLAAHGPLAIYAPGVRPVVDYAPGYLYVLWAAGIAHARFEGGATTWRVLLEIVPIAGDLCLIVLLYRLARTLAGATRALWLAAAAAFLPPLWLDSAIYGQADALPIALAFLALTRALDGRVFASWVSLTVAILVKPLVVVLIPLLELLKVRTKHHVRSLLVAATACLALAYVSALPFTERRSPMGVLGFLAGRYVSGANKATAVSEGAFSVYPLLTGFFTSDAAHLGPFTFATWGIALVLASLASVVLAFGPALIRAQADRRRTLLAFGAACLTLLSLFLFATRMHERYLLPALAFGAPLALDDRPTAIALGWLALSFSVNCVYTLHHFMGGEHHPATVALGRAMIVGNLIAFATLWQRQLCRLATT
jgi:Gpi18-like mannosyltransferase